MERVININIQELIDLLVKKKKESDLCDLTVNSETNQLTVTGIIKDSSSEFPFDKIDSLFD